MTTLHTFRCPACGEGRRASTLFEALRGVAEQNVPACRCGTSIALHLTFDFALDVPDKYAEVLGSFLPDPLEDSWQDSRGRTLLRSEKDATKRRGFPTGTLSGTATKRVVNTDNGCRSWT